MMEDDLLVARLRANLALADIPATDADLEGIVAGGFLRTIPAFERAVSSIDTSTIPDYLHAWGEHDSDHAFPEPATLETRPSSAASAGIESPRGPTLLDVASLIRTRAVSPVEVTRQSLATIERQDPLLNAFQLVLAEQALQAARQAEAEILGGNYRGPLHGVPVAVKDLLAMDGTITTAGSRILPGHVRDFDATAVERLRVAGAVIVGKTRMSEYAYSPGSNNAHFGSTSNPWNLQRDSGGSSSGSAAAVAAGLVYAALGSDTGGSIRIPAAFCGIVGLKPTFGRVSLHGAVPLSWSLDHLGPLTRGVDDAATLLGVLAGADSRDVRTRRISAVDWMPRPEQANGLRGLRIGVLRDDGGATPLASEEILIAWRSGLDALTAMGVELVECDVPELQILRLVGSAIIALEASTFHLPALRTRLKEYGEFPRRRLLAAFAYDSRALLQAQQLRGVLRARCHTAIEGIDVLSLPAMPIVAPALGIPAPTTLTLPFNVLGWPAISVPLGKSADGLPVGMQLVGRPWDEAGVLRVARSVEAAHPALRLASVRQ